MSEFRKTTIQVEVLSQDVDVSGWDITVIAEQMTDGELSGITHVVSVEKLTPLQAAQELMAQGSDPYFFGLDQNGNEQEP